MWERRDASYGPSWELHKTFVANSTWQLVLANACARNAEANQLVTARYAVSKQAGFVPRRHS